MTAPPIRHESTAFPPLAAGQALAAVCLIALLGGSLEGAIVLVRHRLTREPTELFITAEALWATALPAVLVLGAFASGMLAVDRLAPRLQLRRLVVPMAAFACAYSLLIGGKLGLGAWPARILSLGLAALIGRLIGALAARRRTPPSRPVLVTAAALVIVGVLAPLTRAARELRAERRLPAVVAGAPNVIVLIWDTVRAANLSLYGYDHETTPTLTRFAREGVTFERAFATASWSLPSHASLFTGQYPFQLDADYRSALSRRWPTLAEVLAEHGYATGGFTGNLFFGRASYGIDRGFAHYADRPALSLGSIGQTWYLTRRIMERWRDTYGDREQNLVRRRADEVTRDFLTWIDEPRDGRPFFSVINHFDAHEPYLPPPPFDSATRRTSRRYFFDEQTETATPAIQAELRASYDDCIRYLDAQLAVLLQALEARHLRDSTIIIVTSDHGEEFGLRGSEVVGHQRSLNAQVLHVPLVIVDPRASWRGVRRRETVSLRDVPATVMDLVTPGENSPFPGESLRRYANAPADSVLPGRPRYASLSRHPWIRGRQGLPSSYGDLHSVINGDLHYVIDSRGRESLFNIATDPRELHNLAGSRSDEVVTALRTLRQDLSDAMSTPFAPLRAVMGGSVASAR